MKFQEYFLIWNGPQKVEIFNSLYYLTLVLSYNPGLHDVWELMWYQTEDKVKVKIYNFRLILKDIRKSIYVSEVHIPFSTMPLKPSSPCSIQLIQPFLSLRQNRSHKTRVTSLKSINISATHTYNYFIFFSFTLKNLSFPLQVLVVQRCYSGSFNLSPFLVGSHMILFYKLSFFLTQSLLYIFLFFFLWFSFKVGSGYPWVCDSQWSGGLTVIPFFYMELEHPGVSVSMGFLQTILWRHGGVTVRLIMFTFVTSLKQTNTKSLLCFNSFHSSNTNSQHFKRHFYLDCLQFSFPVTPQFLTDSLLPYDLSQNVFTKVTNYFWFPILNEEHSSSASFLSFLKPLLLFCRERAN